ncbi:PREDICTED: chromobox protein homolog 1-like isoform X2 [Diuraphis noxia]|uniref:chromobox protein homolog 1-like isoform X2 n=1 Tax=Diuraphis noxia TaxID=143948 RepID=UPI0007639B7B|nr:PREDICTED: chromobox protein homolog 1-like isoform X2 [Diuraphis noxia]
MSKKINTGVAGLSSPGMKHRSDGFSLGLEPEMIINSKPVEGTNYLLMKWKDVKEPSYVKASVANKKCPSIVIDFYQSHLTWSNF